MPRGGRRSLGSTRQTVAPCAPEPSRCGRRAPIRLVVELGRGRGHVGIDLGLERRNQHPAAPSRTISSRISANSARSASSWTTLNIGASSRRRSNAGTIVWVRWEGTPRSPSGSGFHNFLVISRRGSVQGSQGQAAAMQVL